MIHILKNRTKFASRLLFASVLLSAFHSAVLGQDVETSQVHSPAGAPSQADVKKYHNAAAINGPFILEGKIEHANTLPPVNPKLRPGAKFDLRKMPIDAPLSLLWWRVPDWLSGTWKNEGKVRRLNFIDLEHPEKREGFDMVDVAYPDNEVIGYQEDRYHNVWTAVLTPYMGRTRQGANTNLSVVHSAIPLEISEKQIVLKFLATTAVVSKANKRIVSVSQRESIQTYRPIEGNLVIVLASMKFFDENGKAKFSSEILSHTQKQLPFQEVPFLPAPDSFAVVDLRQSLDKFLRSHGLDHFRPARNYLAPPAGYKVLVP